MRFEVASQEQGCLRCVRTELVRCLGGVYVVSTRSLRGVLPGKVFVFGGRVDMCMATSASPTDILVLQFIL